MLLLQTAIKVALEEATLECFVFAGGIRAEMETQVWHPLILALDSPINLPI